MNERTDKQMERKTNKRPDRENCRADGQKGRLTDRRTDWQTDEQIGRQLDRLEDSWTDRQTGRQTHTDKQTDKLRKPTIDTDRQSAGRIVGRQTGS